MTKLSVPFVVLPMATAAVFAVGGCETILGLKRAELYAPDGGPGTTTSSTTSSTGSSSTSGTGTGGSAPQPSLLAHFANVQVQGVAADPPTGAIYIAGRFPGQSPFGSPPFSSAGGLDMFLVKLAASGSVSWAKQIGGTNDDEGQNVAFSNHAVTVVGQTKGGLSVEGHAVPNAPIMGTPTFFSARYGDDGTLGWLSACTGQGFGDVTVDPTNSDAIFAGWFNGYQCGSQMYFPNQDRDIFVTRLDATAGTEVKTTTFHGGQFNYAETVAIDDFKNIFIGGWVDTNVAIGPYSLPDGSMYVAKLGPNGAVPWASRVGKGTFSAIATDASGDLFAYGTCGDPAQPFGDPSMPAPGGGPVCVAKVSGSAGSVLWARRFGTSAVQAGPAFAGAKTLATRTLAVSSAGDVAIVGSTNGPLSLDGVAVTQPGFVALLNGKTGNVLWVESLNFLTAMVAFSTQEALVVAGTFSGTMDVGATPLTTAAGQVDTFVALFPQ